MTWNFQTLRENSPFGFKPLETHQFYYGSPPNTKFPYKICISNYQEIPKQARSVIKLPTANILIVTQGTRGSERFCAYYPDNRRMEELYFVLDQLHDFNGIENMPLLEDFLSNTRNEIDVRDFGYFEKTLMDYTMTAEARNDKSRKKGDVLALAYLDYLRKNFELRTASKVRHKDLASLSILINEYTQKTGQNITEPAYAN